MPSRKILTLVVCLICFSNFAHAEEISKVERTLTQGGFVTTWGASSFSDFGFGASGMRFEFFDPSSADGLYYSAISNATITRSATGLTIADTRLLMIGWRQSLFGSGFSIDANVTPVVGARYDGNLLLGSAYTGVGFALGAYFPLLPGVDGGISWEPVVNLYNWGAPDSKNMSYNSVAIYLVFKEKFEKKSLPW